MRNLLERISHVSARWRWLIAGLGIVIVLAITVSFLLDEPLRRTAERQINDRLKGYTVRIEKLRFHPIGLSTDVDNLVITQDAHPDPPIMRVPQLRASVQWSQLIRGRVVADFRLDGPSVYYNQQQLATEAKVGVSLNERGWQEALQAAYPLKVNLVRINDGEITYVDAAKAPPLQLSRVKVVIGNIRNIKSGEQDYPSDIHASAQIFETGQVVLDGNADFLAEPHMGIKANFDLSGLDISYFKPILERHRLLVRRGLVTAKGIVEYAVGARMADIRELTVDGADVDYLLTATGEKERQAVRTAHEATKEAANRPEMLFRAESVRVSRSTFGLVNTSGNRKYRVFVADTNLTITNLSNKLSEGTAVATLKAKFMGNGPSAVTANFRPEEKGPDFDVDIRIEDTDMRALNNLLRAHTKLDATQGVFSFYSELAVKNGTVNGYVKPLFRDLQVKAEDASLGKKLKEKAVNIASKILKNEPRDEVATVSRIQGPIDDPKASTIEVVVKLVQNAFFQAILPGFEREAKSASGSPTMGEGMQRSTPPR